VKEKRVYSIRVMTFNIRGFRGVDGKVDPARIAAAIKEGQPDIVALQEVVTDSSPDHLAFLGESLGLEIFGNNLDKGNAFLSRFTLRGLQEHDLGCGGVCLRADADIHGKRLHLFNIHLRAFPFPRRRQMVSLMSADLLGNTDLVCPKVILGDFADPWFGMGTMELFFALRTPPQSFWRPTFPSRFPVFSRDRVYFQGDIAVQSCRVFKGVETRLASSHLPLMLTLKITDSLEYLHNKKIRNNRMETAPGCFRKRTENE
jgi:endonuclease/exonuclease/phosphatase family metal-dependent hydrolase